MDVGNRIFTEMTRADPRAVALFEGIASSSANDEMNRIFCIYDDMKLLNPETARPLFLHRRSAIWTPIPRRAGSRRKSAWRGKPPRCSGAILSGMDRGEVL